MRRYTNNKRTITIMALRYAIAHLSGIVDDENEMASTDREADKQMLADMQAMHLNLTGQEWLS